MLHYYEHVLVVIPHVGCQYPMWAVGTPCGLSLCTVCMPMLFALCLLSGVWQLVRSLTPNMFFTQAVTLCSPCSFFGTYKMLHEQSQWILHSLICKPMTPFQGMHYALWKHLRRTRMPAPFLFVIQDMYNRDEYFLKDGVIRLLVCIRLVG
jgi:hypothetical protein